MPTITRTTRKPTVGRSQAARKQKRSGTAKRATETRKKQARSIRNSSSRARSTRSDAITMLKDDHKRVDGMFKKFARMKTDGEEKHALAHRICKELKIHTAVEEEIFYPAVREAIRDQALMDEADVEHESAKILIAQIESARPGDEYYDAKVAVLGEYIRHHVKEEQTQMFPKARRAKIDLKALGAEIATRKEELNGNGERKTDLLARVFDLPAY